MYKKFFHSFDPKFILIAIFLIIILIHNFRIIYYNYLEIFISGYNIFIILISGALFIIIITITLCFIKNSSEILTKVINLITRFKIYLEIKKNKISDPDLTLIGVVHSQTGRFLRLIYNNNKLLNIEKVLKTLYNTLQANKDFIDYGYNKVIIITVTTSEDFRYQLHHNIFITNDTTFEAYHSKVINIINKHYETGSSAGEDVFRFFEVLVWNMDHLKNKHIKITSDVRSILKNNKNSIQMIKRNYHKVSHITPLKKSANIKRKNFACLDLETIEINKYQEPVAISFTWPKETKLFLIDYDLLKFDYIKAIKKLWKQFFNYLEQISKINSKFNFKTVFVHNLGSFDGIFIFKALLQFYLPSQIKTIVDDDNKFILISVKLNSNVIVFKDSLRIFPVSLQDLCEIFNVDGKSFKYKKDFNKIDMFNNDKLLNEFIYYAIQDSKSLFEALIKSQKQFIKIHNVDITTIVSTSSLALKIFRTNYLNVEIPILKSNEDLFIRQGYFGGATDFYKAYAKNLYYYDINSLYPKAMCNLIPQKIIKKYENMDNVELDSFFGFCLAEIQTPENILKPLLPMKWKGKTIYPKGKWKSVYFSEELKAVKSLGYIIKLIKGIEFSSIDLFTGYVEHFYKIKMNTVGSERWISKLLLNCLYGVFGRKQELLETINIYNHELEKYVCSEIIKHIIPINEKISTLIILKNLNKIFETDLNTSYSKTSKHLNKSIKSNVAIAAAITAYARIHMMQFKLDNGVVYSDTDSIFTTNKIESNLIGSELGLMKDEMNGLIIKEGLFLGIKQYSYWYLDSKEKRIEKSVFAGVKRNSLTFVEVKNLFNGKTLIKETPMRFFRSMIELKIKIKKSKISIKKTSDKILYNNIYLPPIINTKNNNMVTTILNKLIKYKNKVIKKIK
jgi:hypothetical protein